VPENEQNESQQDLAAPQQVVAELGDKPVYSVPTEEGDDRTIADVMGVQTVVLDLETDHEGTSVYLKGWVVPNQDTTPIVIVHDLAEQSALYRTAAKYITEGGRSVYCFDLRGHGRSGRMLGYIKKFSNLVSDLLQVAAWVRHKSGGKPPVILGHGIGAVVATQFCIQHGNFCESLVLSSPSFQMKQAVPKVKRLTIGLLAEWFPKMRLSKALLPKLHPSLGYGEGTFIHSVKPEMVVALTAIFANELLNSQDGIARYFLKLKHRTLVLLPEKELVNDYSIIGRMIKRQKNPELFELKKIDSNHNMLTEDEEVVQHVVKEILEWL